MINKEYGNPVPETIEYKDPETEEISLIPNPHFVPKDPLKPDYFTIPSFEKLKSFPQLVSLKLMDSKCDPISMDRIIDQIQV